MAGKYNQAVIFLAVMAGVVGICSAAIHTVGDQTGWTIPTSSSFYSTWAAKQTIRVGDTLVFNFPAGAHTVAEVSKADYDSCSVANPISAVLNRAPANITIGSAGTHYYICTITGHCSIGQKIAIVAAASSTASPAPKSAKRASSPAPSPSTSSPAAAAAPSTAPAAGPSGIPTTTAGEPSGVPTIPASGPGTAAPPSGNFAAPKAAGLGLVGLISVAAASLLV